MLKISKGQIPLFLTGILSALLGLIVLIGWYIHSTVLIQVHPAFVPMQYNTALGFFLCGAAMVLLTKNLSKPAAILSIIVILTGSLTLLEYIFSVNLGIDQLFIEHYITVATSNPGRMAPNTALCFLLSGISLLILAKPITRQIHQEISGTISSIILALGFVALFGYLVGLETTYGWGNLTRMAVHTSIGFLIIGAGIIGYSWMKIYSQQKGLDLWLAVPAGVGSMTIIIIFWQAVSSYTGITSFFPRNVLLAGSRPSSSPQSPAESSTKLRN